MLPVYRNGFVELASTCKVKLSSDLLCRSQLSPKILVQPFVMAVKKVWSWERGASACALCSRITQIWLWTAHGMLVGPRVNNCTLYGCTLRVTMPQAHTQLHRVHRAQTFRTTVAYLTKKIISYCQTLTFITTLTTSHQWTISRDSHWQ